MIFKLEYKNKDLDVARLEIITPGLVEKTIEGTEDPFRLIYKLDKSDKSGHFLTSSAEINIYETEEFNIDALKTSNETEIKVDYYINNIKKWTGFVIPDFFSKEIGKRSVVSMVASDRIGTLKGVTLTDLNAFVSLRTLAEQCLLKTGLSLPLNTMVDLEADAVNFFNTDAISQRLVDNKGRSISCYDILSSILVSSNSIILQRNAEWYIVNKLQHELGQGKLYSNSTTFTNWQDIIHNFSDVTVGARRTIIPVAASTGVYHEHGGGMLHPDNYDFSKGLTGWTSVGGFVAAVDNKEIKGFTTTSSGAVYTPVYGNATEKSYLINENEYIRNVNPKYIESEEISIPYSGQGSIEVEVNVNALAAAVYATPVFILPVIRIAVVATNGSDVLTLDHSGKFVTMPSINPPVHEQTFEKGEVKNVGDIIPFLTEGKRVKGTLEVSNLEQYKLKIRIYGTQRAVYFHSVDLLMRNTAEAPKGTIFKIEQGSNYTKEHEIDTSIWGDYMTGGLNGYFYKYPIDDTSSLYSNGVLTSKWTDITDPGVERSLLHHITTQRSRMFSQAHDLVSAEMDIRLFDPLSVYVACSKRYTLVSATVDFLRGRANLEIEEAVYQNLTKRDFIYSYFGDGETGVKSIGGISAGASGGGGGLTPEQIEILSWWKLDDDGNLFTELNVYSEKEVSAYGLGSGGSSGGGVDLLQAWTDYDSTKDNWAVKAGLLVPFYNDAKSRLASLEGGAALSLNVTGSGNAIASLTKSGTALTAVKGNFAELDVNGKILSSQLPSYVDDVLEYVNLAAFPTTGETGKIYIAQDSNKTYRWSGTAYVEISASLALGETSSTAYRGDRGKIAYDHSQAEHQAIINGTGFVKANGKTLSYDNNSYSLSSHNHSGVYEPVLGNPSANGYLLSSSTAGARSWVAPYSLPTASASVLGGVKIGENVSIASGVISVHNPVTIGTANGLSLSTQVLSLALATTAANGALSATDKTYIDLLKTFFEYDSTNNAIKALKSFYSTGEVSAYGIGSGGGGGSYDRLDAWVDYDSTKSGWVLSALLGNELNTRVSNLEGGSALTVNTTGTGNAITSISKAGTVITANKGLTFSLSNHLHTGVYEPVFTKNTAFNKNFGTTAGTVAEGNHTHNYLPLNTLRPTVDLNTLYTSGITGGGSGTTNRPSGSYSFSPYMVLQSATDRFVQVWFDSYGGSNIYYRNGNNSVWGDWVTLHHTGNLTSLSQLTDNIGVSTHIANTSNPHSVTKAQVGLGNVDNTADSAKNVLSATKLQTARTIAGVSFDGTANIDIPFDNLSSKPTTLGGYGITDSVTLNTVQTISAKKTFSASLILGLDKNIQGTDGFAGVWNVDDFLWRFGRSGVGSVVNIRSEKVGVGTDSPSYKLDVSGTGRFAGALTAAVSVTTPKVIFAAAGWSVEQSGTEIQFKYNGAIKQRLLSNGTIVGIGEITAFGSTT